MRREFARVGACVSADRLREITAGAAASEEEWTDIEFAMAVTVGLILAMGVGLQVASKVSDELPHSRPHPQRCNAPCEN